MASTSVLEADALQNIGFEVELLAPPGQSRATLAQQLARFFSGSVQRVFHHDTEITMVKGRPVFNHLSLGFKVFDGQGSLRCELVDDITIIDDLDGARPPAPGWYRILSDDRRIMNLAARSCDPVAPPETVLEPLAGLFGTTTESHNNGLTRLNDSDGTTVAAVALQGGERERVCEVIFPPVAENHLETLAAILDLARKSGFRVPTEAAVHVHFDAEPFRSAAALVAVVKLFSTDRQGLMSTLGTNPDCRRINGLPTALIDGVHQPGFADRPWSEVQTWLASLDVAKHADVNLRALAGHRSAVDTVEVRILPGSIDAERIMTKTELLLRLLTNTG